MANATKPLKKEHRAALVICARELGIDPATLSNTNPWCLSTPRSVTLQTLMLKRFPRYAQELIEEAEVPLSLGAQALLDGDENVQMTPALAAEFQSTRPETWNEMQARWGEQQIARHEESMQQRAERNQQINELREVGVADALLASRNQEQMRARGVLR